MSANRSLGTFILALVSAAWSVSAIAQSAVGREVQNLDSAIHAEACPGSCVDILQTESGLLLKVRSPDTGQLFRVVPLDLPWNASIGPLTLQHDSMDGPEGRGDSSVQADPVALHGGTGTVVETAPFTEPGGSGDLQVTYHFVDSVMRDVVARTFYHTGSMPK